MADNPETKRPAQVNIEDVRQLPRTHQAQIPEDYLDLMGHMNVMWYTHLFAHAVGGLSKYLGMNRDYFVNNQAGTFVLKQYVNYLVEVRFGEQVSIYTRLLGRSPKRVHLMHFMVKDGPYVLASTTELLLTHIDMRTRRSSPFLPEISQSIDRLLVEHSALSWPAPLAGPIQP
ncbi:MAG: thioesterase family protein [Planctomycetota bacterium]